MKQTIKWFKELKEEAHKKQISFFLVMILLPFIIIKIIIQNNQSQNDE